MIADSKRAMYDSAWDCGLQENEQSRLFPIVCGSRVWRNEIALFTLKQSEQIRNNIVQTLVFSTDRHTSVFKTAWRRVAVAKLECVLCRLIRPHLIFPKWRERCGFNVFLTRLGWDQTLHCKPHLHDSIETRFLGARRLLMHNLYLALRRQNILVCPGDILAPQWFLATLFSNLRRVRVSTYNAVDLGVWIPDACWYLGGLCHLEKKELEYNCIDLSPCLQMISWSTCSWLVRPVQLAALSCLQDVKLGRSTRSWPPSQHVSPKEDFIKQRLFHTDFMFCNLLRLTLHCIHPCVYALVQGPNFATQTSSRIGHLWMMYQVIGNP